MEALLALGLLEPYNEFDLQVNTVRIKYMFMPGHQHGGQNHNVSSIVGWGTMLQAGRTRVRVLTRWISFNRPDPSSSTMALGSTQPLTETNGNEYHASSWAGGLAREARNLTGICGPIVQRKCGSIDIHNPMGLHGLLQG
jgi:hypothetical protein